MSFLCKLELYSLYPSGVKPYNLIEKFEPRFYFFTMLKPVPWHDKWFLKGQFTYKNNYPLNKHFNTTGHKIVTFWDFFVVLSICPLPLSKGGRPHSKGRFPLRKGGHFLNKDGPEKLKMQKGNLFRKRWYFLWSVMLKWQFKWQLFLSELYL